MFAESTAVSASAVKTIASAGKTRVMSCTYLRDSHPPEAARVQRNTEANVMNPVRFLPFIGRLFIGLPFIMSGASKIMGYNATVALIKSTTLPLPPSVAYVAAIAVEVGCGLLIIVGYRTRAAAAIFALFCLATAVFFHAHFSDPNQTFHFIKNLVMTGGLLQIVANGAGAFSIDARHAKASLPGGALPAAN
jgi:putative oxidoreductase